MFSRHITGELHAVIRVSIYKKDVGAEDCAAYPIMVILPLGLKGIAERSVESGRLLNMTLG
jgi:hypothetical protein